MGGHNHPFLVPSHFHVTCIQSPVTLIQIHGNWVRAWGFEPAVCDHQPSSIVLLSAFCPRQCVVVFLFILVWVRVGSSEMQLTLAVQIPTWKK